jgi:hypothetical protein
LKPLPEYLFVQHFLSSLIATIRISGGPIRGTRTPGRIQSQFWGITKRHGTFGATFFPGIHVAEREGESMN